MEHSIFKVTLLKIKIYLRIFKDKKKSRLKIKIKILFLEKTLKCLKLKSLDIPN